MKRNEEYSPLIVLPGGILMWGQSPIIILWPAATPFPPNFRSLSSPFCRPAFCSACQWSDGRGQRQRYRCVGRFPKPVPWPVQTGINHELYTLQALLPPSARSSYLPERDRESLTVPERGGRQGDAASRRPSSPRLMCPPLDTVDRTPCFTTINFAPC